MHLLWTITYITEDGVHSFLEADTKVEATDKVRELVQSGVNLDNITVFPHGTGQYGKDFYVEIPDLEFGQYCILFSDGDPIIVNSDGVLLDSDDPECPNTVDGIWNSVSKIATDWAIVRDLVDKGADFGTGYHKLEVDNQISGTIERIVRGTL